MNGRLFDVCVDLRFDLRVGLCVGLLALSGCGGGGKPATMTGKVTFNGVPVAEGSMRLDPTGESENRSVGAKITNGEYSFGAEQKLQAGSYEVSIQAFKKAAGKDAGKDGKQNEIVRYIPAKFNDNTELTVEVEPGENTRDFLLKP